MKGASPHPAAAVTHCVPSVTSQRIANRCATPYPMAATSSQDLAAQTPAYMGMQQNEMPPQYPYQHSNNAPMSMMMPPAPPPSLPVNYSLLNNDNDKIISHEYVMSLTHELITIQKQYINRFENISEQLSLVESLLRINDHNAKYGTKRQGATMTIFEQQNKYMRRN